MVDQFEFQKSKTFAYPWMETETGFQKLGHNDFVNRWADINGHRYMWDSVLISQVQSSSHYSGICHFDAMGTSRWESILHRIHEYCHVTVDSTLFSLPSHLSSIKKKKEMKNKKVLSLKMHCSAFWVCMWLCFLFLVSCPACKDSFLWPLVLHTKHTKLPSLTHLYFLYSLRPHAQRLAFSANLQRRKSGKKTKWIGAQKRPRVLPRWTPNFEMNLKNSARVSPTINVHIWV